MKEYEIPPKLWAKMERYLPRMKQRSGRAGRPPHSWKDIMDAIFWILRTGAPWYALPRCFPPKSTVHERFQLLVRERFFERVVRAVAQELEAEGVLDFEEGFIDGSFAPAKRGAQRSAKRSAEKARK